MDGQYRIGDIVFHNWAIKEKLGEGSFGKVYEIQREDFGQIYLAALKVVTIPQSETELRRQLEDGVSQQSAATYFYSIVEEIVQEFALMARLKGTANIVSYEDHAVVRHQSGIGWDILIRMELLTPLLAYAQGNPFTRRDVIRLAIDMCRALELCQKYNIIHRDIKPQNIFVSANGDFKLGDFGIARTVEKTISNLTKIGTPDYMAPEVHWDLEYGFSVDIYSLGLVLYRLLNRNRLPFLPPAPESITYSSLERASARRKNGEDIPPPFHAEGRLAEIVLRAMSYLPKDRYSSPRQMREDLEPILYDKENAEIIYPDGDDIPLPENIYTPFVPKEVVCSKEIRESHETQKLLVTQPEGTEYILKPPVTASDHSDPSLEPEKRTPFKLNWEEYEEIKDISPHEEHAEKKKPLLIMLAAVAICLGFLIFFGVRVLIGMLDTPVIKNDDKPLGSVGSTSSIPSANTSRDSDTDDTAITSITIKGVSYSTELTELYLNDLDLTDTDIEPLRYMTNLTSLFLGSNQISDISALQGLTNLEYLVLYGLPISSINALKGLTHLQFLDLQYTSISETQITELRTALPNCEIVYPTLENSTPASNMITIKNVAYNTELAELDLHEQNLIDSNLEPLKYMTNLTKLVLYDNQITDISALEGLTGLTYLDLTYTQIKNISALQGLTNLETLSLRGIQISDISTLRTLTNLTWLVLGENQISDISALKELTNLQKLYLDNNPLSEVQIEELRTALPNCEIAY